MDVFALLVLLLSCRIQAAAAQLKLSPSTLTILRGEEARFTCSPANSQWTVMVWLMNSTVVLTISNLHGVLLSPNVNVTAEKSPKGDSWVFVLKHVERLHHGEVVCDLQGIGRRTSSLFVQESGSVRVSGDSRMAFRGQPVLFECRAAGWYPQPYLQWQVNDRKLSQSQYNISNEESEKSLFTVTSNLSVTAAKSSRVDCLASVAALASPLRSSLRLTVVAEVTQEGDDCTVPLAVTASLAALLLLLLLCICTVLCYRQKTQAKSSPQEAARFDQSVTMQSSVGEGAGGRVNLGYSSEVITDAVFNELIREFQSRPDFSSGDQVPDLVSSRSLSLHSESPPPMTIRRITTV